MTNKKNLIDKLKKYDNFLKEKIDKLKTKANEELGRVGEFREFHEQLGYSLRHHAFMLEKAQKELYEFIPELKNYKPNQNKK